MKCHTLIEWFTHPEKKLPGIINRERTGNFMPIDLPAIMAHVRAQARPNSHGAILLAEIERLRAAIQAHHDRKHGTTHSRAVLAPPDRVLYAAAGIDHRTLEWREGGNYGHSLGAERHHEKRDER